MRRFLATVMCFSSLLSIAAPVPPYQPLTSSQIQDLLRDLDSPNLETATLAEQTLTGHLREAIVPITALWRTNPPQETAARLARLYKLAALNETKILLRAETALRANADVVTHVKVTRELKKCLDEAYAKARNGNAQARRPDWDKTLKEAVTACGFTAVTDDASVFVAHKKAYVAIWAGNDDVQLTAGSFDEKTTNFTREPIRLKGTDLFTKSELEWLKYQTGSAGKFEVEIPFSIETNSFPQHIRFLWEGESNFFYSFNNAFEAALRAENLSARTPRLISAAHDLYSERLADRDTVFPFREEPKEEPK